MRILESFSHDALQIAMLIYTKINALGLIGS